jgi:hypothetical protein
MQIQVARIQRRVPEYGWTTQKVFQFLNFVVNGGIQFNLCYVQKIQFNLCWRKTLHAPLHQQLSIVYC